MPPRLLQIVSGERLQPRNLAFHISVADNEQLLTSPGNHFTDIKYNLRIASWRPLKIDVIFDDIETQAADAATEETVVNLYRIENTRSGLVLGTYEAASEAQALDRLADAAGYGSYADLREQVPAQPGEIVVTECGIWCEVADDEGPYEAGDLGFVVQEEDVVDGGIRIHLAARPAGHEPTLHGLAGCWGNVNNTARGVGLVVEVEPPPPWISGNGRVLVRQLDGDELRAALRTLGYPELIPAQPGEMPVPEAGIWCDPSVDGRYELGEIGFVVEVADVVDGSRSIVLNAHPAGRHEPTLYGLAGGRNNVHVTARGVGLVIEVAPSGRGLVKRLDGDELRAALTTMGYPDLV